jgi:hypothetical protein
MKYEEFRNTYLMGDNVTLLSNGLEIRMMIINCEIEHVPPFHSPVHSYRAIALGDVSNNFNTMGGNSHMPAMHPTYAHVVTSSGDQISCHVDSIQFSSPMMDITTMGDSERVFAPMRRECEICFHIDETCFDDFPIKKRTFNTKKEKTFTPFDRFDILDFDD